MPSSCAYVMLANFSSEPLTMPKATVLGIAKGVSETLVDRINAGSQANSNLPTKPPRKEKNQALYRKLLKRKLDQLSWEERQLIEPVPLKFAHVFHDEETNDFKSTNVTEHKMPGEQCAAHKETPIPNTLCAKGGNAAKRGHQGKQLAVGSSSDFGT